MLSFENVVADPDDNEGASDWPSGNIARDVQCAFLQAMHEHKMGESLTHVLEECEAKWDRLFRVPVGDSESRRRTGPGPAGLRLGATHPPPGLTKEQAVLRAVQERRKVMMPDKECADYLTTLFTESELKVYRIALEHDWKVDVLKDVVNLLRDPSFDANDIRDGLHSKFQTLIQVSLLLVQAVILYVCPLNH
jgi:hypothetical protein